VIVANDEVDAVAGNFSGLTEERLLIIDALVSSAPVLASAADDDEGEADAVFAELGEDDWGDELFGEPKQPLPDDVNNGKKGGKKK
jgi:hypothetical protein